MPYIKQEHRLQLAEQGPHGRRALPRNPGELNYLFTEIALAYFHFSPGYQSINDIIGALEGAKLEFYRRHVVPYEDKKIEENGDVGPIPKAIWHTHDVPEFQTPTADPTTWDENVSNP